MDTVLREPWTAESFLAWEDQQEGRHEFDGERAIAMTGGSLAHQKLVFNLLRLLDDRLVPPFEAVQEMRVRNAGRVRYPDVCVFAGPIPPNTRTLTKAAAIFEVLSDETASTDRAIKPAEYAGLPGIAVYALVDQERREVTLCRRRGDGWIASAHVSGELDLPEIGVRLPLDAIYAKLPL